jgi:hypothetical protein
MAQLIDINKFMNNIERLFINYIIMNAEKLLKALDDDKNDDLLNFTSVKLKEMTLNILKELHLSKKQTVEIFKKLKNYKYIDSINYLKPGAFIRWVPIDDPSNIYLTKSAIFCEIKLTDNNINCLCKNFGYGNRYFQIDSEQNLLFQKLTDQQLVLLSALDHLIT